MIDPDGRQHEAYLYQAALQASGGDEQKAKALYREWKEGDIEGKRTALEIAADTPGDWFELTTGRTVTGREGCRVCAGIALALPFVATAAIRKAGEFLGLLSPGRQSDVVRNSLKAHEFAQAQDVVSLRGGQFVGAPEGSFPGIDGHLDGVPVSLKRYTGGSPLGVLTHASKAHKSALNAGYSQRRIIH